MWQVRSHEFGPLIPYEMRVGESGTMVCTGTETAIVLYTRAIDDPRLRRRPSRWRWRTCWPR